MEEAYASYLDARKRLAEVKASRGYFPVVALATPVDSQPSRQLPVSASLPSSSRPSKGKFKGHAKSGGKGRPNSGKSSSNPGGKAVARAKATTCLRCGQPGHWASQCPMPSSSSAPVSAAKRPRDAINMAQHQCSTAVAPDSAFSVISVGRLVAQQDGGASAMLAGHRPIMEAITHLLSRGVPLDRFAFTKSNRRFMFGGDGSLVATWSVHLPVYVRGVAGRLQVFIVDAASDVSSHPPDFEHDLCSVLGGEPTTALLGSGGEFMLQLDEGLDEDSLQ